MEWVPAVGRCNGVRVIAAIVVVALVAGYERAGATPATQPSEGRAEPDWPAVVRAAARAMVDPESRDGSPALFATDATIGPLAAPGGEDARLGTAFVGHAILTARAFVDDGQTPIAAAIAADLRVAAEALAATPAMAVPANLVDSLQPSGDPVAAELVASRWIGRVLGVAADEAFGVIVLWKPCSIGCGPGGRCAPPASRLTFVLLGQAQDEAGRPRIALLRWATAAQLLSGEALADDA